jgi:hypothetical protein
MPPWAALSRAAPVLAEQQYACTAAAAGVDRLRSPLCIPHHAGPAHSTPAATSLAAHSGYAMTAGPRRCVWSQQQASHSRASAAAKQVSAAHNRTARAAFYSVSYMGHAHDRPCHCGLYCALAHCTHVVPTVRGGGPCCAAPCVPQGCRPHSADSKLRNILCARNAFLLVCNGLYAAQPTSCNLGLSALLCLHAQPIHQRVSPWPTTAQRLPVLCVAGRALQHALLGKVALAVPGLQQNILETLAGANPCMFG